MLLLLAVCFVSCTQNVPIEEPVVVSERTPTTEPTEPTEEPVTIPQEEIMIKAIKEYPAYIVDQCGTIWGIPQSFQGEYHKERIVIETTDGDALSGIDFFTIDGVLFIQHTYPTESSGETVTAIDYYRQESGIVSLVDSIPAMPPASRVAYDGTEWLIESSVISGVPVSMLYNRNPEIVASNGNYGGRGAWIRTFPEVNGFVVLDKGILVMTDTAAFFCPSNRTSLTEVAEKGRLWK